MIKNERQQRITARKLAELRRSLAALRDKKGEAVGSDRRLRRAQEDGCRSLIEELQGELREYEELRRGRLRTFSCDSLAGLPLVLIKARIARGLSQKELADLCGLKEQQIQRYEATDYHSAALWRLLEIAAVLRVEVRATATLKPFAVATEAAAKTARRA